MWIGGYDDWTPAEQREWDKDIAEAEREKREREVKLHWLELALDDPMFKATYTRVYSSNLYVVNITQNLPSKEGVRNLEFEVVYPLYQGLNEIIEKTTTSRTTKIKIKVSSSEHWEVVYTCECTLDQWSYTKMDEIMEGLADQLTMKQTLNRGLLLTLSVDEDL